MAGPQRTDLRDAIIAAGMEMGDELGLEGITMRAIASRLGVSVTQLYQHFDTKFAIVDALRLSGLLRLDAAFASTSDVDDGPTRLRNIALAYLDFAQQNRWLYALMFDGASIDWRGVLDRERDIALGPMHTTRRAFADGLAQGAFRSGLDLDTVVLEVWASLHGCASLGMRGWFAICHNGAQQDTKTVFANHLVAAYLA